MGPGVPVDDTDNVDCGEARIKNDLLSIEKVISVYLRIKYKIMKDNDTKEET